MERVLKPYDKECMRLAMLKHEETFKEQVYELHRLYRVQKLLMRNHTDKTNKSRNTTTTNTNYSTHQKNHQETWNSGFSFIPNNTTTTTTNPEVEESNGELIEECNIELTLGPASYAKKKRRNNNNNNKVPDETPPLTSESAGPSSFSSSSTGSSQINRTESGMIKNQNGSSISNVDHRLEQQQQAPWFFQVLSLNMT